jgi:hypothetical protein
MNEIKILDSTFPPLTFGERFVSDLFREFVNTLPCSYPNCKNEPSDAHHVQHKSAGKSAGDEITIPLCRLHHSKWVSIQKFEQETGLKIGNVIRSVWQRFIRSMEILLDEEQAEPRKAKLYQLKKQDSPFKKVKGTKLEKCKTCSFKAFPTDEIRHYDYCLHSTENAQK